MVAFNKNRPLVQTGLDFPNMGQMTEAIEILSKTAGVSARRVLPYQVASIVKYAMNRTRSLKKDKNKYYAARKAARSLGLTQKAQKHGAVAVGGKAWASINIGRMSKTGNIGKAHLTFKHKHTGKLYTPITHKGGGVPYASPWFKYNRQQLQDMNDNVEDFMHEYKRLDPFYQQASHFAKRSWFDILLDIQRVFGVDWQQVPPIRITGMAKILKAKARDGRSYDNGFSSDLSKKPELLIVEIRNTFPGWQQAELDQKLQFASQGRANAVLRDMKNGLFNDLKDVASRYPFLTTF